MACINPTIEGSVELFERSKTLEASPQDKSRYGFAGV